MRTFIIAFLAFSLAASPALNVRADTIKIGSITWTYSIVGRNATIEGMSNAKGDVVIPSAIEGPTINYTVTKIGAWALRGHSEMTSVIIPNGVKTIDYSAFEGCSGLTQVELPDSVTSIGESAFLMCTKLKSVSIPDSVTSIGAGAFSSCSNLANVKIPNGVKSIQANTFSYCTSLANANIPESVISIGDCAFQETALSSVSIPDATTSIGDRAFSCNTLRSITVGPFIGSHSLSDSFPVTQLSKIVLRESVTNIVDYAFDRCSSLLWIVIPESVARIGERAFRDCVSLERIYLEQKKNKVSGWNIFSGAPEDLTIFISDDYANQLASVYGELPERWPKDAPNDSWSRPLSVGHKDLIDIKFDANGGYIDVDVEKSKMEPNEELVGLLPSAKRIGYTFAGWYNNPYLGEKVTPLTVVNSDMTCLYAHWFKHATFVSDGNTPWSEINQSGTWRSGKITTGKSSLKTVVSGTGTVSFKWKVSCHSSYGKLYFYIDNVRLDTISGEVDWKDKSFSINTIGDHTLEWRYYKSSNTSSGSDCGWMDSFVWESPVPKKEIAVSDCATITVANDHYEIVATNNSTLLESDIRSYTTINGSTIETTKGYDVTFVGSGSRASVSLAPILFGANTHSMPNTGHPIIDDFVRVLVNVEEEELSTIPSANAGETICAIPVCSIPGLCYQAAWGADINNLTYGEKVYADAELIYLGVIKQEGDCGFYKIIVSD